MGVPTNDIGTGLILFCIFTAGVNSSGKSRSSLHVHVFPRYGGVVTNSVPNRECLFSFLFFFFFFFFFWGGGGEGAPLLFSDDFFPNTIT